jgi:hypothetical protein
MLAPNSPSVARGVEVANIVGRSVSTNSSGERFAKASACSSLSRAAAGGRDAPHPACAEASMSVCGTDGWRRESSRTQAERYEALHAAEPELGFWDGES